MGRGASPFRRWPGVSIPAPQSGDLRSGSVGYVHFSQRGTVLERKALIMRMTFNPGTGAFIIRVPRNDAMLANALREEHGFDFSTTASTPAEGVFFSREPFAAAPFWDHADEAARAALAGIQSEIESSWRGESEAHIRCPADQELWPFQKAGVEYALRRSNVLFGDQPGLGKTPQAICLANELNAKRVLVICPANIRYQWASYIRRWSTMAAPYVVYPILQGKHGVHPNAAWNIVSYDLARTAAIGKALAKGKYDLLILDEAHYLKTIDSQRTRAVFGGGNEREFDYLASRCGYVAALTGTPLPNRPREAYTLARGICWDAIDFSSEESFRARYNPAVQETGHRLDGSTYTYIDERTGRHGELQSRLRANFMVRRLKRDVMTQLKLPELDIVHVEENGAVKAALKAESMLNIDPTNLEGVNAETLGSIATVRRLMGRAIAPFASDYVKMLIDGGEEKIFLVCYHREVGDYLETHLRSFGLVRVDGSTSARRKQASVQAFIDDPTIRIFLGQLLSVGTGTDGLQQVCSRGVAAESDWVFGNNQQVIDRLDRGGQKGTVLFDFLVARGSFSEKVLAKSIEKGHVVHAALDKQVGQ